MMKKYGYSAANLNIFKILFKGILIKFLKPFKQLTHRRGSYYMFRKPRNTRDEPVAYFAFLQALSIVG
jgi:hypothetical protein